jgi:hypothetical protein
MPGEVRIPNNLAINMSAMASFHVKAQLGVTYQVKVSILISSLISSPPKSLEAFYANQRFRF